MTKYVPDCNGLSRISDDGQWSLVDCCGSRVGDSYSYIHACADGLYKVEKGVRKNFMRADGSLVMGEWHHEVGNVRLGMFIFSDTVRKSKHNPRTRYIYGVGHVSGFVLFPMIFNNAQWLKDDNAIYVELDEKPFLIDKGGSLYDLSREHLPKKLVVDYSEKLFREVDDFPFTGLKNRVCQGCIYAEGINQFGEGCGKLFTRGFRNRYLKGVCEYRKTSVERLSEHEVTELYRQDKAKKKAIKASSVQPNRQQEDITNMPLCGVS